MESSGQATFGYRPTTVRNLKVLKAPEENGTEKDHEDFLRAIREHVLVAWHQGPDIAHVLKERELPDIPEPVDLDKSETRDWKKRVWESEVDEYIKRMRVLGENLKALYSLILGNVSTMTRSKVVSTKGFGDADKSLDPFWLLDTLDDIMLGFERIKYPINSLDDQLTKIMTATQKPGETNEDFVKRIGREIKIYEKHGGELLWGKNEREKIKKLKERFKEGKEIKDEEIDEGDFDDDEEEPEDDTSYPSTSAPTKSKEPGESKDSGDKRQELLEELRVLKKKLKERIAAAVILKRADKKKYGTLQAKLANSYLLGTDNYPKSSAATLKILNNYKPEMSGSRSNERGVARSNSGRNGSVSFLQSGDTVTCRFLKGHNTNSYFPNIKCHKCGFNGHYKSNCPWANDEEGNGIPEEQASNNGGAAGQEVSNVKKGVLLNQNSNSRINPWYILLDSESNENIFCNEALVTDVKETTDGEVLRLESNGGHLDTRHKAKFGSIDTWFNRYSLANILSLALVSDVYRVTLDTDVVNALIIHVTKDFQMKFYRTEDNLYAYDATGVDAGDLRKAFCFLNTVEQNKKMFKQRDVKKADEANVLNRRINHVAKDKFERIVKDNWIRNCPVTVGDIRRSHIIYGPPLPPIKGRTRDKETPHVKEYGIIQIPRSLYEYLKDVVLCIDFHFVNGVTVFHSISRKIDYRTVAFPLSKSKVSMIKEYRSIQQIYHSRGFRISQVHADNEFEPIRQDILPARLECCGTDDHVPEIKRSVQTQKNENRSGCHAMPYKCMPRIMVREIVKQGNEFLNAFGSADSAGNGLSPRNIIDNLPHVDYNDLKYEFGEYVQIHVGADRTNNMESRTVGAIVLGPRNLTGRYNFMSLESGQQIDGRVVAQFPISNEVIARVEQLGREQRQPYGQSQRLMYEWRPGKPVADDDVMEAPADPPMMVPEPIMNSKPQDGTLPPQGADMNAVPTLPILQSEEVNQNHLENQGARDEGASPATPQVDHAPTTTFQRDQTVSNDKNQGAETNLGEIGKEENSGEGEILFQNEEEEIIFYDDPDSSTLYDVAEEDVEETDDDEEVQVSDDESFEEVKASTAEDKQRRGSHWDSGPGYGRGMRNKNKTTKKYGLDLLQKKLKMKKEKEKEAEKGGEKQKTSYAFLQKSFTELGEEQKHEYFGEAWKQLKLTGKTEMMERFTTGMVFAQMSVNKGIKMYGREAELKLMAEFAQLLEYQVFHGLDARKLSLKQKKGAANMISIIEEKFNRGHTPENPVIKARSVFNGAVQKGLYSKEETASPTVCIDSFFILCLINALEGRDKAITDVKGAYLNARMKDLVIMKIIGREAELFCELDPSLTKFLTEEKGKKVLYVQLDRALYGCVKSALLWYETYSGTLSELGFVLNPYDLCVANADINGKQCTICWYVDDNMISHMDPEVVDEVIKKIEEKYGKMSQTRGDDQEFLGMKIKFKKGRFSVSMKKHIKKAFDLFSEEVTRKAATPAKSYLFEVREDSAPLDEERAENFHSVVALLLFISRRCRLDIQPAVGFLSTRVSCPD